MEDALSKLAGNLVSIRSRVEAVRREVETQESWSSAFVPDTWGAKDEHFQGRV